MSVVEGLTAQVDMALLAEGLLCSERSAGYLEPYEGTRTFAQEIMRALQETSHMSQKTAQVSQEPARPSPEATHTSQETMHISPEPEHPSQETVRASLEPAPVL